MPWKRKLALAFSMSALCNEEAHALHKKSRAVPRLILCRRSASGSIPACPGKGSTLASDWSLTKMPFDLAFLPSLTVTEWRPGTRVILA